MAKEQVTKKRAAAQGGKKKVSPYNKYMKDQLAKVKAANPELSHKEAFKKVAESWKDSPDNPKNAKQ